MTAAEDVTGESGKVQPWYFRARPPVRWLTPKEIVAGAYGEFFGGLFSKFVDNRDRIDLLRPGVVHITGSAPAAEEDREAALPDQERAKANQSRCQEMLWSRAPWSEDERGAEHSEPGDEGEPSAISEGDEGFWIDYVADVGDGFGPTYRVAEVIANDDLPLGEYNLKRGELLVFGGDQVYPAAGRSQYRNRTVGPYALAFSEAEDPKRRPGFAVPGNHDWYDGLSAFLERFTLSEAELGQEPIESGPGIDSSLQTGPWSRHQTRSYFAAELRHGWWLFGVDMGLDPKSGVSAEQTEYFKTVARLIDEREAPQSVIVCISEPAWIKRREEEVPREADSWDQLVEFLSTAFTEGWTSSVRVIVTGDKHYYARHEATDPKLPVLVTAGGGGAYLSSTLDVPDSVRLNTEPLGFPGSGKPQEASFNLAKRNNGSKAEWPSKTESRRMGIQGLVRNPLLNPALNAIFSFIYGLYAYVTITGWRRPSFARDQSLVRTLNRIDTGSFGEVLETTLLGPVVTAGGFAFLTAVFTAIGLHAWSAGGRAERVRGVLFGLLHGLLHVIAMVSGLVLAVRLTWDADTGSVTWWPVVVMLLAGLVVMAAPEVWNRIVFKVWEPIQLIYFVPALIVLGLLFLADWLRPGGIQSGETGALTAVVGAAVLGATFGTVAFTLALIFGQSANIGLNELFVGLRHSTYKNFLRIELTPNEARVNVVGLKRTIPRAVSDAQSGAPTLVTPHKIGTEGIRGGWPRQTSPELVDRIVIPARNE